MAELGKWIQFRYLEKKEARKMGTFHKFFDKRYCHQIKSQVEAAGASQPSKKFWGLSLGYFSAFFSIFHNFWNYPILSHKVEGHVGPICPQQRAWPLRRGKSKETSSFATLLSAETIKWLLSGDDTSSSSHHFVKDLLSVPSFGSPPRVSADGWRHLWRTYVRYVPLCSVSLSFPFWYFPNRSQKRHFHKSCYANARQTPSSRPNTYI